MDKRDHLIKIYTGTEICCMALQAELEQRGVIALIQNDFQSAINTGFGMGTPSSVDLYIPESNLKLAMDVIAVFKLNNPG